MLALLVAPVFYYLKQVPTAARHEASALARALKKAAGSALEYAAYDPIAPDRPAAKGRLERALAELEAAAAGHELDATALLKLVPDLPASIDQVNELLAKKVKLRLHAYSKDPKFVAVYEPIATLTPSSQPIPLVHMLGEALTSDHADDWLMRDARHPVVSLRGIAREVVDLLIAAAETPTLCPVSIRLQSHLAIGVAIDGVYHDTAVKAGANDPSKLNALCRRERLRGLAHEELLAKQGSFPFVPALLMSESEIALLERLMNPEKTPGLGGKARSHMNGMSVADNELHSIVSALAAPVRALGAELAYEHAVFASAHMLSDPKDVALDAVAATPAAAIERCAFSATYAATPNKVRFAAQSVLRLSGEKWPPEDERNGLLAFLYSQSGEALPKEALASGAQMSKLWAALQKAPAAKPCGPNMVPFAQAVDEKTASAIAAALLAE